MGQTQVNQDLHKELRLIRLQEMSPSIFNPDSTRTYTQNIHFFKRYAISSCSAMNRLTWVVFIFWSQRKKKNKNGKCESIHSFLYRFMHQVFILSSNVPDLLRSTKHGQWRYNCHLMKRNQQDRWDGSQQDGSPPEFSRPLKLTNFLCQKQSENQA